MIDSVIYYLNTRVKLATELISLGILFLCAIVGGIIAARFKQPAVFGLLLVGAIIGPNSLNLVRDMNIINIMADFGAILILFFIGLEFDVSKLMKLGARSILIGLLKFAIVLFLGYETTLLLGFSAKAALFVGVILSFSSTIVVVKVLEQKEMFSRKEVPLLVAVLIIEDILAVFALTFFSGVKGASSLISTFEHIIFSLGILIFAYYIMIKILKYIANIILKNSSDEYGLPFLSLGIGTLFSYFALYLGLTPSAGAFLAGSLVASLPNSKEYGRAILPYALILTSIFFISMGTLVDFKAAKANIALIAALIIIVLISRFIAIGFLTFLLANFKNEQPFFSSIAMISVGEFSLLVAKESDKFGLGIDLLTITAVIIFITAILMSISINYSEKLHNAFASKIPLRTKLKLERVSDYMRKFFDQMEIENFFTKKLRSESKLASIIIVLAIFTFFILRRISFLIRYNFHPFILYGFYIISAVILLFLVNIIFNRLKAIHHTLSVILTNVDNSRNLKKCARILNNLLVALLLFFSAMLFPFAIFLLNLNMWSNIIPVLLIAMAFYYLKNSLRLIDGHGSISSYSASISVAKI